MKSCSGQVLQNRLKQKVNLIEDAVARVAHNRLQLKDNADLVKLEIRESFGQQLSLLRAREQQLLSTLDTVIAVKDEILTQQQDSLHQALGSCQQSLDCLSLDNVEEKMMNSDRPDVVVCEAVEEKINQTLDRLAGLELKPKETSQLGFEADHFAVRRHLQTFGRILSSGKTFKRPESLPGEMEEYDSASLMSHKSLHQLSKPLTCSLSSSPMDHHRRSSSTTEHWLKSPIEGQQTLDPTLSRTVANRLSPNEPVNQWLSGMKNRSDTETPESTVDDFDVIQKGTESRGSTTISGFTTLPDIKNQPSAIENPDDDQEVDNHYLQQEKTSAADAAHLLFDEYFAKILNGNRSEWLLRNAGGGADMITILPSEGQDDDFRLPEIQIDEQDLYTEQPANLKFNHNCTKNENNKQITWLVQDNGKQLEEELSSGIENWAKIWCQARFHLQNLPREAWLTNNTNQQASAVDEEEMDDDDDLETGNDKMNKNSTNHHLNPPNQQRLMDHQSNQQQWIIPSSNHQQQQYTNGMGDDQMVMEMSKNGGGDWRSKWLCKESETSSSPLNQGQAAPPSRAVEDSLNWAAVLERVHGQGDDYWLRKN